MRFKLHYAMDLYDHINAVRDRAAYKTGKDRSAYVAGSIAYTNNPAANTAAFVSFSYNKTYYESNNNMPVTTTSTLTSMHLNSVTDIFISTLVARCNTFNDEARPQANKHYLRPIPQNFLESIKKEGKPLNAEQKTQMQNPGW